MVSVMGFFFRRKPSPSTDEVAFAALRVQAEDGDAEAQFNLGLHYSSANPEAPDFAQALGWYLKAGEQNHRLAQFNLGVMYSLGQVPPSDPETAIDWMRRAAEGGDAGAQYQLGVRCHRASLEPRRPNGAEFRIEAYKWYSLAAAQGYADVLDACDQINLNMTRAEVDEGKRRAAAFIAALPAEPQTP